MSLIHARVLLKGCSVVVASGVLLIGTACESSPKGEKATPGEHTQAQEARGRDAAVALNEGQTVGTPLNTVCPIGGHGADEMIPVAYKGKTIGFCCGGCVDEFSTMDAAGKDQVLARAEKNVGPE